MKRLDSATGLRLVALASLLGILAALLLFKQVLPRMQAANAASEPAQVRTEIIADKLEHPWGLAFLPDGSMLVTERPGRLQRLDNGSRQSIQGLPEIIARGQGGLMDVVLHPDFADNRWVYLSYTEPGEGGMGTAVGRGKLEGDSLTGWQTLFRLHPKTDIRRHFGSRIVFDRQGYMYITTGDRGERERAQDLADSAGTMIRLHDDGRIPQDNPFIGKSNVRPDIYSYGHRNLQGAALHPQTGALWTHEHGPQGGDELNIIRPGVNYGWPVITYGEEYGTGIDIGDTHKDGMAQPLHYWVPSIAPSGMAFYTGDKFPDWQGDLFVGSLKFSLLVRLELDGDEVVDEQRLLQNRLGRIRDVRQGPDGYIYLLTDASNGQLVRLRPPSASGN